jgi:peptide/nickel transport system permease protein
VLSYCARRLGAGLVVVWLVATATFLVLQAVPGDPARILLDPRIGAERAAAQRAAWGLDRPLATQYLHWLDRTLRGDWGRSFTSGREVTTILADALPASLALGTAAAAFGLFAGLVIAAAGTWSGGTVDRLLGLGSLALYAQPPFWIAMLLLLAASRLAPGLAFAPLGAAGRWPPLSTLLLPALALGLVAAGQIARYARALLGEAMAQDFVRTARAKGLGPAAVLLRHALPAAAGPLLALLGTLLPVLASGALAVEVVFAWPGLGRVAYLAASSRDYPVILAVTTVVTGLTVLGSLAADLAHAAVDPRLRLAVREPR